MCQPQGHARTPAVEHLFPPHHLMPPAPPHCKHHSACSCSAPLSPYNCYINMCTSAQQRVVVPTPVPPSCDSETQHWLGILVCSQAIWSAPVQMCRCLLLLAAVKQPLAAAVGALLQLRRPPLSAAPCPQPLAAGRCCRPLPMLLPLLLLSAAAPGVFGLRTH